jgi:hypothetical protein
MVLRSVTDPIPGFRISLTDTQDQFVEVLLAGLDSSMNLFEAIHDLSYSLLSDCHPDAFENKFECVQIKHIILSQLRAGGVFASPLAISSAISRKKWHMRATGTLEASYQKDQYEQKMFG